MKAKQAEWIADLHPKIAEHIVQIHNQTLVMNQFAEFLNGNPERYK